MQRSRQTVFIGLGVAVLLAVGAWAAGGQIQSPAQVAAETAAPAASAITVPVERKVLSSEVIVRGTVRYGAPQPVLLATSILKQNSTGSVGGDVVTKRPTTGARFGEGTTIMSVGGRPLFVLRGRQPSHRDITPGSKGPDVRQLEAALARMGFAPGQIDGRYDGKTATAVAAWYEKSGWAPFGPTDTQLDQLRAAKAAAAQARDAYLQSRVTAEAKANPVLPGDIAQARIDLATARDALITARHDVKAQSRSVALARLEAQRDAAIAAADVAAKGAAVETAQDAYIEAQRNLAEAPPDTSPSERAALQAGVRQAASGVNVARADLTASQATARATRAQGRDAVTKAQAERLRASRALPGARRQVTLNARRLALLRTPGNNSLERLVTQAAGREARDAAADASRLAAKMGVAVPANEVLFFPTLPLRVDSVRVRTGDTVNGRVMTVSNSRLAVDSSLSLSDAKLVGASVKLSIAVKSTEQAVLAVPLNALSVGADGSSRVLVQRPNGLTEYVIVVPGLSANGLVQVKPVQGKLAVGDLVVVGSKDGTNGGSSAAAPSGATGTPAGGSTTPQGGSTQSAPSGAGSTGVTGVTGSTGASGGAGATSGSSGAGRGP